MVIFNLVDSLVIVVLIKVMVEKLCSFGMIVWVDDMIWVVLIERCVSCGLFSDGGWNIFYMWWLVVDVMDLMVIVFFGDLVFGWYGWLNDLFLENLCVFYLGV